jgi:hypothetical protein
MNLGQYFGKPNYGMLLPPSYQEGKYKAVGQIYTNPDFRSYTAPNKWTEIYQGMMPAGVTPRTALNIYGPSIMPPAQNIRLKEANKANIEDVKAFENKKIMKAFEKKQKAKIEVLKQAEKSPKIKKNPVAKKIIAEKKKEIRKEIKKAKIVGKALIKNQKTQSAIDAVASETAGARAFGMHGLGLRPDYSAVMPPAMKGPLMDIVGRGSNYPTIADINAGKGLGGISLAADIIKDIAIAGIVAGGLYYWLCKKNCRKNPRKKANDFFSGKNMRAKWQKLMDQGISPTFAIRRMEEIFGMKWSGIRPKLGKKFGPMPS